MSLPHIDVFMENGYTKEEMKIVWETKKILEDDRIEVNPTAVRVPVFFAHSEAVAIETEQPITAAEVTELLRSAPGVSVVEGQDYPTALTTANQDNVFVGRIRSDLDNPNGINLMDSRRQRSQRRRIKRRTDRRITIGAKFRITLGSVGWMEC